MLGCGRRAVANTVTTYLTMNLMIQKTPSNTIYPLTLQYNRFTQRCSSQFSISILISPKISIGMIHLREMGQYPGCSSKILKFSIRDMYHCHPLLKPLRRPFDLAFTNTLLSKELPLDLPLPLHLPSTQANSPLTHFCLSPLERGNPRKRQGLLITSKSPLVSPHS